MEINFEKVSALFRNKKLWFRVLLTLVIIGGISYVILSDMSCQYKGFQCSTKSKVNVDIKK